MKKFFTTLSLIIILGSFLVSCFPTTIMKERKEITGPDGKKTIEYTERVIQTPGSQPGISLKHEELLD